MNENNDAMQASTEVHEARVFLSREDAVAFLQNMPTASTIIIITPPPH